MEGKVVALTANERLQLAMSKAMSKKVDQIAQIVQGKGHTVTIKVEEPTLIIDTVTNNTIMKAGKSSINIESVEVQTLKHSHQKLIDELELAHIDNVKKMHLDFEVSRNDLMENCRESEKKITEELIKLQEDERLRKIAEDKKEMEEYTKKLEELEQARKNLQSNYYKQLSNLNREKEE